MSRVRLYDKESIHILPWKCIREGNRIYSYLTELVQGDVKTYIVNVETKFMILTIDDLALPITVNEEEYSNSHICSPFSHYVSSALEELKKIRNNVSQIILKGIIKGLGVIFKWGLINKVVCVNNWLIPTNLYPEITLEQLKEITSFLRITFPNHVIQFRSLNQATNSSLIKHLQSLKYQMILSRQVYIIDGSNPYAFRARMFKKDLALSGTSPYQFHLIEKDWIERAVSLYEAIYMDKYSSHNPQYTPHWVDLITKSECWTVRAVKNLTNMDGVFASIRFGPTMTMPFFGYDTSLPQSSGLYRIISTKTAMEARKEKIHLNMSGGAATFKRLRRATPLLEYSAVYLTQLSLRQKLPWKLLQILFNRVGAYLLQKYSL